MRVLIALLLQNPSLVGLLDKDVQFINQDLHEKGGELFIELVQICRENVGIFPGGILEHFRDTDHYRPLELLMNWDHMIDPDNIEQSFTETFDFFCHKALERKMDILMAKERQVGLTDDEKLELAQLLMQK